jgi:hypothetical protein
MKSFELKSGEVNSNMTLELHDTDSFNGSIDDTASEQLEVQVNKADVVELLIDDGATGSAPASHDIVVEYYSTAIDDYMQVDSSTGSTALSPSVIGTARGQKYRVTVTNSSGASDNFRVSLEAFKEI